MVDNIYGPEAFEIAQVFQEAIQKVGESYIDEVQPFVVVEF